MSSLTFAPVASSGFLLSFVRRDGRRRRRPRVCHPSSPFCWTWSNRSPPRTLGSLGPRLRMGSTPCKHKSRDKQHSTAQANTVTRKVAIITSQRKATQHDTTQPQNKAVQHSTTQHSTYSTAQHSAPKHKIQENKNENKKNCRYLVVFRTCAVRRRRGPTVALPLASDRRLASGPRLHPHRK